MGHLIKSHLSCSAARRQTTFHGRNVQGASVIARQLQELKRPPWIAGVVSLAERDQDAGEKVRAAVSERADVQRYCQSGQKPTAKLWRLRLMWARLIPTTWKIISSTSTETIRLELHQWTSATLRQDSHKFKPERLFELQRLGAPRSEH